MKYRKLMLTAVCLLIVGIMSGCGDSVSTVQLSPTSQIQPETQATPTLQENPKQEWIRPTDEMTMIHVPSGTFQMGSSPSEIEAAIALCQAHYSICNRWYYERESPLHSVSLDDFWIDQTEVSNAQYRLCVEAGICVEPTTCKKGVPTFGDPDKSDHPVVCINWEEALYYCEWAGTRLPTEAEWEYAFRGVERVIYPWGNEFDGTRLNYCDQNCDQSHADSRFDDTFSHTAPVGSFSSGISWAGASNMSGNVSEWVSDWFGEYSDEARTNPSGPSTGSEKMLKGCSWFFHPTYCRGALRASVNPDTRFDYLGFRCASSAPITSPPVTEHPKETVQPQESTESTKTQAMTAEVQGDSWQRPHDEMTMLLVPAGTFQMGGDKNDSAVTPAELPQHEVELDSFWIDQIEVMNAQYNLCVAAGICRESYYKNNTNYNGDDYPAVGIAWDEAVDYCNWAGGRLPTEAEWEYAAKGQSGSIYPWGNEFNGDLVNFCDDNCGENWADANFDDGYRESAPAGSFPEGASWIGALDMAGNVWEWTWDWCADFSSGSQINPQGPDEGDCKIIRGGAWASPSDGVRTTYRMMSSEITPDIRHPNIGFRCVVSGNQQDERNAATVSDPIIVPPGKPPTIDGTHASGEWNAATIDTFADDSQLLLKQAGGDLYLGIRANETGMIAANVFIQRGDEISILHSSAALGTAIYQHGEKSWQQIQDFTWQCRNTSLSDAAQAERDAFLQQEGWVAANGRMGTPNELEYQIKIPEGDFRLAVVYIKATPPYEKVPWPAQLTDETIKPTSGGLPKIFYFSPEQWAALTLAQ